MRARAIRLVSRGLRTSSSTRRADSKPRDQKASSDKLRLLGPPELSRCVPHKSVPWLDGKPSSAARESEEDFLSRIRSWKRFGQARVEPGEDRLFSGLGSQSYCFQLLQIPPDANSAKLLQHIERAWKEDALTTLKLIFHLRRVRTMTGKSDKLQFYDAACWLHKNHPRTLLANIDKVPVVGYHKDLLELILRILEGEEETKQRLAESAFKGKKAKTKMRSLKLPSERFRIRNKKEMYMSSLALRRQRTRDRRIQQSIIKDEKEKRAAAGLRRSRRLELARRAVDRHNKDSTYRSLFEAVANLFAESLAADIKVLEVNGDRASLTLAAKWCPSLDSSYDKRTLICEAIACRLFPKNSSPEYGQLKQEHYVYRVRDRLRKEVLVPLRKALQLPEVFMSQQLWTELPYEKVPWVASRTYRHLFTKHDYERHKNYVQDSMASKKTALIVGDPPFVHDVLSEVLEEDQHRVEAGELQWTKMVHELKDMDRFPSTLSLCEVSTTMKAATVKLCIGLGLLTSELSQPPWKGHVLTFDRQPKLHLISGQNLQDKYYAVRKLPRGSSVDLVKALDCILSRAISLRLSPDEMIEKVFVFTEKEFEQATGQAQQSSFFSKQSSVVDSFEADHAAVCKKFKDAGYTVPQVVFWSLRDLRCVPLLKQQAGVTIIYGYSRRLLRTFLDSGGRLDHRLVLEQTVSGSVYDELKLVD